MGKIHPQASERIEEADKAYRHKARPRLVVESEMPGGQHILILMHFDVCSYMRRCGVLSFL